MSTLLICSKSAKEINSKIRDDAKIYNIKRTNVDIFFTYNNDADDYLIKFTNFEDS